MTTNVIDLAAKQVASDSRWSFTADDGLFHYVEETSFDKIGINDDVVMVCAGDARLIDAWKTWLQQPSFFHTTPPETEVVRNGVVHPVYVALITRPECELLYCKGVYWLVDGTFMFTGTGGEYARDCFSTNKNIEKCIGSAADVDDHTGGPVKRVDVATGKGNLAHPPKGVDDIYESYNQRGFIMDRKTRVITPVTQPAANDQSVHGREMHFSAPTGQPASAWTREDHLRLGKALQVLSDRADARRDK